MEQCKYIVVVITDNDVSNEIATRIQCGNRVTTALNNLMRTKIVTRNKELSILHI